jgi:hypothetical protein
VFNWSGSSSILRFAENEVGLLLYLYRCIFHGLLLYYGSLFPPGEKCSQNRNYRTCRFRPSTAELDEEALKVEVTSRHPLFSNSNIS